MKLMKILFVWPNKDSFGFKPIGLAILSAIAKKQGHETMLFDTTKFDFGYIDNTSSGESAKIFKHVDLSPYNLSKQKFSLEEEFTKIFNEFKPDLLAFTVLSDEYHIAGEIVRIARERERELKQKVIILWGGKYPTLNPEKSLMQYDTDYVCVGEGVEAFPEFLNAIKNKQPATNINNIWSKQEGIILKTEIRPLKRDLDDLPYADWSIFDRRHFYKPFDGKVYLGGDHMLNWGCPYHCTYCINSFYHKLYDNKYYLRRYSVNRIIEELIYLKETYQVEFFKFHDEDFLMRPAENLKELSEEYRKKVNIPFVIETNPKSVTEEKALLLKNMNCVSASLAIETGDPRIRKDILKRVDTKEDIINAFKVLKKVGIRTSSFNLLAIPYETRETYWETVKLNREADIQYPYIGFFFPFEGTELRALAIKEGLFDPEEKDKAKVYLRDRPSLSFANVSEQQLIEWRNVFVLYVKLPEIYEKYILRSETKDEIGLKLRKKILEIYDQTVWSNNGWYKEENVDQSIQELDWIMNS